jgi:hypothetical protein
MEDNRTIKDKIIDFVRNSPEEVNTILYAFIAGMQAQKNLTDSRREMGRDSFSIVKTESAKNRKDKV